MFAHNIFRNHLAGINPDILIGYRLTSYAYIAAKTGFHPFVAVAQSQKAAGEHRVIRKPLQWLAARYAVRAADLALAWAPHMKNDILSLGGSDTKIVVVPRGVDLRLFASGWNGSRNETINIITTRGLNPGYNLSVVLQAVEKLKDTIDVVYTVIGDGSERDNLMRFARDLRIEKHVKFVGRVTYEEISDYLAEADIYVSPVPEDGVSSSLLEAMAAGLFPVVSDIEANRHWADKGCKLMLFDPFNPDELAINILKFLKNREYYERSLKSNRKIVEIEANWQKNMKIIEEKLLQLIVHCGAHEKRSPL
jgi:glycosyltransferase involved in cell wall biosynthesis